MIGHRKKRRLLFFLITGIFLSSLAAFLYYNHVDQIIVTGCENYKESVIKKEVLNGKFDGNSVLLYLRYRYLGLKKLPYIEKITIKREDSHTVRMRVYEKSLVACMKYMGQYVYFDKKGIVLKTTEKALKGIPCISGVDFTGFTLYEKLKVEDAGIFDQILDLSRVMDHRQLKADKILFNTKQEVVLTSGKVKVYLGKRKFYDEQVAALSGILPQSVALSVEGTIDMEDYSPGDDVIFKKKDTAAKEKNSKKKTQKSKEKEANDTKQELQGQETD